ncbi:MAG: CBS domain-containing protein [Myxococcales bacterium]|nr:MAG: CBS domain-containing protein [Myxococcales bacterium]
MSSERYVVVMGTDFSAHATRAFRAAYEQALSHERAELHVVHASLTGSPDAEAVSAAHLGVVNATSASLEEQRQKLAEHLDQQLASLEGGPDSRLKVFGHVVAEAPSLAIVCLASQLGASLIVMGSRGLHGFSRWVLGSVTEGVLRRAECAVLVIPPPASHAETRTVGAATHLSPSAGATSNGGEIMTKSMPHIKKYMSADVHTIGDEQPMSVAHRVMREHRIRHLPVLHRGKLVGVVTDRDLRFVETLEDVDPTKVSVSEAMTAEVYTVDPDIGLDEVVSAMAVHKYGAAVVVDHGHVVGIFTTVDACRAFADLLKTRLTQ